MCTNVFKERCTYTRNVAYDHVRCLERGKRETRGGDGENSESERERERKRERERERAFVCE